MSDLIETIIRREKQNVATSTEIQAGIELVLLSGQIEEKDAEIARLRAELAAPRSGGWKLIDTAPRDGTHILGLGRAPGGDLHIRETRWCFYGAGSIAYEEYQNGKGPSGDWGWSEPMNNWASSWELTYWMPLPAPPQDGGENG